MDLLPASDFWWRYFIYGALFHFVATTSFCKTPQQVSLFRFAGYAIGVLPILLREALIYAILMAACLFAWSLALTFFKKKYF